MHNLDMKILYIAALLLLLSGVSRVVMHDFKRLVRDWKKFRAELTDSSLPAEQPEAAKKIHSSSVLGLLDRKTND